MFVNNCKIARNKVKLNLIAYDNNFKRQDVNYNQMLTAKGGYKSISR